MEEKESQIKAMKNRKKIIKRIRVTPSFWFLLLLPSSLSKSLKETPKNFSSICPRAVMDFWRRSLLFKIESGAFWGEEMLSGAKQNRSLRPEKKRFWPKKFTRFLDRELFSTRKDNFLGQKVHAVFLQQDLHCSSCA